jgi:hypothetical protein
MRILFCALLIALSSAAHAADRLPKSVLGRWATELDACWEQVSEIRIIVEPRSVRWHEQEHQVRRVTGMKDGSLKVSGYEVTLDGRGRSTITMKLIEPDRLKVNEEIFLRCKEKDEKGNAR